MKGNWSGQQICFKQKFRISQAQVSNWLGSVPSAYLCGLCSLSSRLAISGASLNSGFVSLKFRKCGYDSRQYRMSLGRPDGVQQARSLIQDESHGVM